MTLTIPLKAQRKGFGIVSFCYDNSTGQGTHIGPRLAAHSHRKHDPRLNLLYEPGGYIEDPEEQIRLYEGYLLPLCNDPDPAAHALSRGVVYPEAEVGDAVMYESSTMHEGTPNTRGDNRDVLAITYSWRGCSQSLAEDPESPDAWRCAECFHCANKEFWADSPFGIDGPFNQRQKIAANYHARRKVRASAWQCPIPASHATNPPARAPRAPPPPKACPLVAHVRRT